MQVQPTDVDVVILAGDVGSGIDGACWVKDHFDCEHSALRSLLLELYQ